MLNKFNIVPIFFHLLYLSVASGQSPVCDGTFYFSIATTNTALYRFNSATLNFDLITQQLPILNGMGINPVDNFIYALYESDKLMRIEANGAFTSLGKIDGMEGGGIWAGDFSPLGEYVVTGSNSKIFRIDVNSTIPIVSGVAEKHYVNGTGSNIPIFGDITFDAVSGQCYGFDMNVRKLAKLDPVTGAVDAFGIKQENFSAVGAITSDVQGNLYGFVQDEIYQIDKLTGAFKYLLNGPFNEGGIDACACPYYMDLMKTVSKERACAGDTLVYSFHLVNSSQNELYNLSFVDSLPAPLSFVSDPSNLMGGNLADNSGKGYSHVEITNMSVPIGTSSFHLLVNVPPGLSQQMYLYNQAKMYGFPPGLSDEVFSDDANTFYLNDATQVIISPPIDYEINIQSSSPLCLGDTLLLQANAIEPGTYQWNGPQGYSREDANIMFSEVEYEHGGRYFLHFTNYLGCSIDTFAEVGVYPIPEPNLGSDTAFCLSEPETLYPGDFYDYQWQNGSADKHFIVEGYGNYWVTVANEFGCTNSDSIIISNGCVAQVYVPSAFSPNQDGINDVLYAYAYEVVQYQMQVYDRWGELVFKSNNINKGWDGTFRGKPMPAGIFTYLIEAHFLNGQSVREYGDLTLIR